MKNTVRKSKIKMVILMTVYIFLMIFFVMEDLNLFETIQENIYSLSIYKPF